MSCTDEETLSTWERRHAAGLTSVQILELLQELEVVFSEATLRKYVQLGLLPRSVRVGRKGKHQGSQGLYPVGVVRQILRIREMMAESYTIEQIQREFLFLRGELEQLQQTLSTLFRKLDDRIREREAEGTTDLVSRQISSARTLSEELVKRLTVIEEHLTARRQPQEQQAAC